MHNRVRSKAIGGVNGYCVYIQYGYYRSGIEGSTVSFKSCFSIRVNALGNRVLEWKQYNVGVNMPGNRVLDLP